MESNATRYQTRILCTGRCTGPPRKSRNKDSLMGCQSGQIDSPRSRAHPFPASPGCLLTPWYQGSPSQHRHCPGNPRRHRNIERCSLCTWVCDLKLVGSDRARIQKQVGRWPKPIRSKCEPLWLEGKASAYNAGDLGLIPGSGRFPGEGNGNPLQYSCLENPMDREAW